MRFMMIVKANKYSEEGCAPDPRLMEAVGRMAEEAFKSGTMVESGGLAPSAKGKRLRIGGGKMTVIDGPFVEAKELVGGYAIMRFDSAEEALENGKRFMALHQEILGPSYEGELEIRQILGPEDYA